MKIMRNVLSIFLVIVLAAGLITGELSVIFGRNLGNPDFYLSKFKRYGFYDDVQKYLSKGIGGLVTDKKISSMLSKDVVTSDWVERESNNLVVGMLEYTKGKTSEFPEIDYNPVISKLENNVGIVLTEIGTAKTIQDKIIEILKKNDKNYITKLPFSSSWDSDERSQFIEAMVLPRKAMTGMLWAPYAALAMIVISLGILLLLYGMTRTWGKIVGWTIFTVGIVTAVISGILALLLSYAPGKSMFVLLNVFSEGIIVNMPSISLITINIVQDLLRPLIAGGCVLIVLGIILTEVFRNRRPREYSKKVF